MFCSYVFGIIMESCLPIVQHKDNTLSSLGMGNSALQVYFAHMKNNQTGDFPCDPRHIYVNPYNPTVCPLLSLTMYLLVTPPTSSSALFPGSDQYNRYNKYLRNLLERKEVYVMRNYGVDVGEIGAHSARKGAAT